MSLMKSLARVAAGVMLAKGVGAMMKNAQGRQGQSGQRQSSGGLLDDLLGNNTGNAGGRGTGSGGLGDMLGQVLGGRTGSGSAQGGLGGILDQLSAGAAAGGLGGMLGGILGGSQQQSYDRLTQKGAQSQNNASFGELFNDSLATQQEPEIPPTAEQNALAGLMLRAMIQAAKADGEIDEQEKSRLMSQFGDLDDDEREFIREQMAAPVDAVALAREVPQGYGPQIYLMSLMAIEFDNRKEAEYLHELAQNLGLDKAAVNEIHDKIGVTNLYA